MSNQLLQEARTAIELAEQMAQHAVTPEETQAAQVQVEKARNNLLSAYANSTIAQKQQLEEMQECLNQIDNEYQ
ncbi:hypothetical protein BTR23_06535 [Alkalihalophilus pseudofirmus]|uniref:DUF3813 family protein n=1 Tax=Alkalihalobacterium alkalinitrilicum TaxID=427920 RepID=UPI00094C3FCC|nr:DUF3813 family protein [Alkalihalobacterium alkalinitrilicum]OLO40636.1 hypothetical protein BTR23_06535 [Alkalihalophilus pseudofirmus]